MRAGTHTTFGLACGTCLMAMEGQTDTAIIYPFLIGTLTGSLLPDIDHPGSKISRKNLATQAAGTAVSKMFGHRGLIHSLWFCLLASAAAAALCLIVGQATNADLTAWTYPLSYGILTGTVSHLLADSFNKGGICWLPPLQRKRTRFAKIKTGSPEERIFWLASVAALLLLSFVWFGRTSGGLSITELANNILQ